MWNEFMEPFLANRRKQKQELWDWLEDNPGYERKRWWK
jgi:hypothetical protein